MSFLKKLFGGGTGSSDSGMYLYVRCDKCQEPIRIRINPANDLSPVYESDGDDPTGYEVTKEIMGNKCFNLMHGTWRFNRARKKLDGEVEGGAEISREEYEAATAEQPQQ